MLENVFWLVKFMRECVPCSLWRAECYCELMNRMVQSFKAGQPGTSDDEPKREIVKKKDRAWYATGINIQQTPPAGIRFCCFFF